MVKKEKNNSLRDKFREHEKTLKENRRVAGGKKRISGTFVILLLVVGLLIVWSWR